MPPVTRAENVLTVRVTYMFNPISRRKTYEWSIMMKKKVFDIEIETTNDGYIDLWQSDFGHEDDHVRIHPDQVDMLINWLKEAKKKLLEAEQ